MCHTVSFQIPSSIEIASPGINYLTLSIVSLNQMLVMRFCGTCTSFEVLELFKVSIQSLIPISEVIFVIPNDKYRKTNDFVNFVQDLQSSVDSKSTDSKILSSGSLGDSFLATCAL
ncbi:hypothetical protein L2E82_45728 [Cichorium intybus]|uniref:Uncharacterized protein n=1 Tax=Cichorium intybus TaxID=13427 RepID=A0ACB8ZSW4_CICIN|nr:hypothetical protein L2E82_45728 [Cichorium intybus]